jgi:predicted O-linked N-acetylglucosamine transferase (SPINDLY family)
VGYVSADLRTHSVAFFMQKLLRHHDRAAVEVFCYADPMPADDMTQRLKATTDVWRDIHGYSPQRLADVVRQDAIDILVDLHGHTTGSKLLAFALKPAPVQVTYLGYPATTGLSAMDYRLTDARADPVESVGGAPVADALHSEQLVRLPDTFLCWQAPDDSPPCVREPAPDRRLTFASFNTMTKVSPATIAMWAQILKRRPESILMIKAVGLADAGTRQGVLTRFAELGVAENRLVLVDRVPGLASHLAMYQQVDVALDTYPYHGTTTTCEALWMGVPVVTRAGAVHASRVGVSLLHSVGLDDLVADSAQEYVEKALRIADDPDRRRLLRESMRPRMAASPLMDGPRFARAVEQAYRDMWQRWCAKNPT